MKKVLFVLVDLLYVGQVLAMLQDCNIPTKNRIISNMVNFFIIINYFYIIYRK